MKKNYYQIDRRDGSGVLDGYEMVKAQNIDLALQAYLGSDYEYYTISKSHINGKVVITARCPQETSGYIEIFRAIEG